MFLKWSYSVLRYRGTPTMAKACGQVELIQTNSSAVIAQPVLLSPCRHTLEED